MTLAVAEKLRRKVMIEHREEECSRRWMLRQETIDGQWLTDDTRGVNTHSLISAFNQSGATHRTAPCSAVPQRTGCSV